MTIVRANYTVPSGNRVRATAPLVYGQFVAAASQVSLTGSDVTQWNDRTGVGGAVVTAPEALPTYSAVGWNGDQPALEFAMAHQCLGNTAGPLASYMSVLSSPFTLVAVFQANSIGDWDLMGWTDSSRNRSIRFGLNNTSLTALRVTNNVGALSAAAGGPLPDLDPHVIALAYDGTSVLGTVDGQNAFEQGFSLSNVTVDRFFIGSTNAAGSQLYGELAEARVYASALNFAQIQGVRAELKQTWGGLP